MEERTRLINVYLKIHQKRDLSWDDLECLALYDPECFEKTCKNVVYNIPQTEKVIFHKEEKQLTIPLTENKKNQKENQFSIEQALKNLKRMEGRQMPFVDFDLDRVKNLLGNLYMELLFPHNDKDNSFYVSGEETGSIFDKKA